MAVRLADYYTGHVRRVKIVCVAMLIAINTAFVVLLTMSRVDLLFTGIFITLPVVSLQVFALIVILRYAMEPLEILTRAITHTSPQANDVKPPILNEPRYSKTGLKTMVQTVYDRTIVTQDDANATPSNGTLPSQVLDQFPCGIIVLDEAQNVVYNNSLAPVIADPKGIKHVELMFSEEDSLVEWLKASEDSKVSDQHIWTRIQNRLPDANGRQLFDVFGHYQKGGAGGMDTVIITVDRTGHYGVDEEDMDFIALAAHELRGPITVIRGYLDVLINELEPVLQGDQRELLDRLSVSASRLSGYVGNILNVSRYDRRHLKLYLREDKIADIYSSIADDLQLRARTQNRMLSVSFPADLPTIAADRNSLSEVMANLVDNAIKYSSEGGQVVVTAAVDGNFVRCNIQDFGIGIPSSVVGNLFSKFYRSHKSRQTVSGTGLGLYISKGIIESHGGQIGVRSTEGQGSVFSFSVPIYSTVADKLMASDNGNEGIIESSSGWIKNHSMFKG